MQFMFDLLPIILFFIAFKLYGVYAATLSAMIVSGLQVAYTWFKTREFQKMQLITLFTIFILGGLTLFLHNDIFIKWKPTILNWILASVFLVSEFFGNKNFTQRLLDSKIDLPTAVWRRLNLSWVFFFSLIGLANLYVAYHFDTDIWVNFKLFGVLGLTLLFVMIQSIFLSKHVHDHGKTQ